MMNNERMEITNMPTASKLLDEMLSEENLNKASCQAIKNKGANGVNGIEYTEIKEYLKKHREVIRRKYEKESINPKQSEGWKYPKMMEA